MKKLIPFLFILTVILFSCTEQEQPFTEKADKFTALDPHFVDMNEAIFLATTMEYSDSPTKSAEVYKQIDTIVPVPDTEGKNAYYIVNYDEGGFIIISADTRVDPILAFSENSEVPFDQYVLPGGLLDWFSETQEYVSDVRNEETRKSMPILKPWNRHTFAKASAFVKSGKKLNGQDELTDAIVCPDATYTTGPLMTTRWGQGEGYNDMAPEMGCDKYINKRAPTGCVATAVAQVMKYHEHPKDRYDWAEMQNIRGTNATARLMAEVGNYLDMNYTCKGSGASTSDVPKMLKSKYGYSSAEFGDFNVDVVKKEIFAKRPVILAGGRKDGWWIFASYEDGHTWVCDGYMYSTSYDYEFDGQGYCNTYHTFQYLYMNWGWGTHSPNGWFRPQEWNPEGNDFNYKKKMITRIIP